MRTFSRREIIKSLLSIPLLGTLSNAWAKSSRSNALPRVFIIGDSISIGYTPFVVKALEGKAIVTRPKVNCNGTRMGVEKLDEWLGQEKYDLIHFNFGLHDIKHVDVKTGEGTNNAADPLQSMLPVYKKNLEWIVKRLKATGAVVVFASTTPVPERSNRVMREPEQLTKYNKAALRIMRKHHIPVDDLFHFAQPLLKEYQKPNDVHFTDKGYELLGTEVASCIQKTLKF